MRAVARIVIGCAVLAAIYLLFAGQLSTTEAIAGVPVSLGTALYAYALRRTASRPLGLAAPWGRLMLSVAKSIVLDTGRVAAVLIRGGHGTSDRQPFHAGAAPEVGRRALVTLALSLAPNGFVTEIGPDELMLHRLTSHAPNPDRAWPL